MLELGWHVTMLNIIPRPSELPFLLMEQLETGDTVRSNYWSFMVIVSYRKFLNTLLCLFRDNSLWHNHWLPFSEKIPLENALNRNEMEWYVKMSWCYKVISSVALALWNYWQTERKREKRYFFLLDLCENHLLIMRRNSYDPFKMSVLFCQQPIIKCCLTVMKLLTNWQRKRKKNRSSSIYAKIG